MPQLSLRSIDNMHLSRDFMCYEPSAATIDAVIRAEQGAHVDTVTVDMPYDAATAYAKCTPRDPIAYENLWLSSIRAHGMHVWFRQMWLTWEGNYGAPKLTPATQPAVPFGSDPNAVLNGTDVISYMARTYHFILSHGSFFKSGDIFTPESEPANAGILPYCTQPCMFPSHAAADKWLRDSMTVDRAAFSHLGLRVKVGYWGLACSTTWLTTATVQSMGVLTTDCYYESPATLIQKLSALHARYGVPIVLGEWGDIWQGGAQPASSNEIDAVYSALRNQAYLIGISYWQGFGSPTGEGLIDHATLHLNQSGARIQAWFK